MQKVWIPSKTEFQVEMVIFCLRISSCDKTKDNCHIIYTFMILTPKSWKCD